MQLTLYYMPRTRAFRVRWMLEELELDYRLERVDLFSGEAESPEFRAVHPLGQLPALDIDGEPMLESGAIVQWLAGAFPAKALAPALDSPARREFDQWMYFAVTTLEGPAWELALHGRILPESTAVKSILPFASERYRQALDMMEHVMGERDYLVNNAFSAADIMLGNTVMWFPEYLESRPALADYSERLSARAAFQRASAD